MLLLTLLVAYLVGALPLGYWLVRRMSGRDPRLASAYNLGLENSLKLLGTSWVTIAFATDVTKAAVVVALAAGVSLESGLLASLALYVGHLYPPTAFSGGLLRARGAGVLLGLVLGLAMAGLPLGQTLLALVPPLLALMLWGYTSLASVLLPVGLAVGVWFLPLMLLPKLAATALALLALWRHKENLARLGEGLEPRLGQPLPLPSENQAVCAFMVHPLTPEDVFQAGRFRWAKPLVERGLIPQSLIERLAEQVRPMKVGELRGVRTLDGREIRVYLISAPLLPHQITSKPELATLRAIQAAKLAQELGCTVFGLGAFWSVVGEKGQKVQEAVPDIQVTNGGAYTAGTVKAAIPSILAHFGQLGHDLSQITAAVVGANGVVAFGIARQVAPLVRKLILVGRNSERLEKSAASLRKNLERKGYVPEMVLSTDVAAISEADLVFSATSDPRPVIFAQHVKPGAWLYDEGVPPDVDESVRQVLGVRVIPGGVVRPPGAMQGNLNLHFGEGAVPACLAETMILAAEKAYDRKSLGGETKSENIQFFVDRAEALGFRVVD